MLCRKGEKWELPGPRDLIPLPRGSDIFLLPGRNALGMNPKSGDLEYLEAPAVAAFLPPGYTLTATAAYLTESGAPCLPLFAYGAVGYEQETFWVCASLIDKDPRQSFHHISRDKIEKGVRNLLRRHPRNRVLRHLAGCATDYGCPNAKNLALGRFEAPLPTASSCNAECVGCISRQPPGSEIPATQQRIGFRPTPEELVQIMQSHAKQAFHPLLSFGQGCEGEPLLESELIEGAISEHRKKGGKGTVHINTNASLPGVIPGLARAGLDSIRVSLNSARSRLYSPYFRPRGYDLSHVQQAMQTAKEEGVFVSVNYLFFPGINDTEEEIEALAELVRSTGVDCLQLRNLNLDPEIYLRTVALPESPSMGLHNFRKRLKKLFPGLRIGYFNPDLGSS